MWLPRDERRLLAGYYRMIGDVAPLHEEAYEVTNLARLLHAWASHKGVPAYGDPDDEGRPQRDVEQMKKAIRRLTAECTRVEKANRLLAARGLITLEKHTSEINVVIVGLTIEGYDLGRRYASLWERSGLWFREYREHWVWLVAAAIGAAFAREALVWLKGIIARIT